LLLLDGVEVHNLTDWMISTQPQVPLDGVVLELAVAVALEEDLTGARQLGVEEAFAGAAAPATRACRGDGAGERRVASTPSTRGRRSKDTASSVQQPPVVRTSNSTPHGCVQQLAAGVVQIRPPLYHKSHDVGPPFIHCFEKQLPGNIGVTINAQKFVGTSGSLCGIERFAVVECIV